jgi:hypothetical protein
VGSKPELQMLPILQDPFTLIAGGIMGWCDGYSLP